MLPAPSCRPDPGPRRRPGLTWQHTRKMKRVMAVHSTFSLNWIYGRAGRPRQEVTSTRKRADTDSAQTPLSAQRSKPWTVHTRRRMSMCVLRAFCVHVCAQSYPTLCDPTDVARQAHLAMDFPRQEYWSGLPFPSPGDLPDPGIEPSSPVLQAHSSPRSHPGSLSVCKAQMQRPACTSSHLIFTQCNVILTVLQEN